MACAAAGRGEEISGGSQTRREMGDGTDARARPRRGSPARSSAVSRSTGRSSSPCSRARRETACRRRKPRRCSTPMSRRKQTATLGRLCQSFATCARGRLPAGPGARCSRQLSRSRRLARTLTPLRCTRRPDRRATRPVAAESFPRARRPRGNIEGGNPRPQLTGQASRPRSRYGDNKGGHCDRQKYAESSAAGFSVRLKVFPEFLTVSELSSSGRGVSGAGRDWWLTMLTDAQVAAQASDFRAETRLGVAAQAFALVGAPKSKTAERGMHRRSSGNEHTRR